MTGARQRLRRWLADARGAPRSRHADPDDGLVERMVDAWLLGRFAAGAAHATNNDLQVVLGAVELLDGAPAPATAQRRLGMIAEAGGEAAARTADLQALARGGDVVEPSSAPTLGVTLAEHAARLARLASIDANFAARTEPALGALPLTVPDGWRLFVRLLGCLVLRASEASPAAGTPGPSLHVGWDGDDRRTLCLRLDHARVEGPLGAAPGRGVAECSDGTTLAIVARLLTGVGGALACGERDDARAELVVTLPVRALSPERERRV